MRWKGAAWEDERAHLRARCGSGFGGGFGLCGDCAEGIMIDGGRLRGTRCVCLGGNGDVCGWCDEVWYLEASRAKHRMRWEMPP